MNLFIYLLLPYMAYSASFFIPQRIILNQMVRRNLLSQHSQSQLNAWKYNIPNLRNSTEPDNDDSWNCGEIPWDLLPETNTSSARPFESNETHKWSSAFHGLLSIFYTNNDYYETNELTVFTY